MDGILSLDSSDIKTGIKRKDILIKKPQVDQTNSPKIEVKAAPAGVMFKLRDINKDLVQAWKEVFKGCDHVEVSEGDIFKNAPAADAIVSPANSFGYMDGGIDLAYSRHFGWQLMSRLQEIIMTEKDGELLVGDAIITPTCQQFWGNAGKTSWEEYNQGTPIKYLISAPTMRVPMDVSDSVNAYLAFRAVIIAVQKHNANTSKTGLLPISSVLCPGLATNVGRMPPKKCAKQMKCAYEIYELKEDQYLQNPESLGSVWEHHLYMASNEEYNPEITFLEES
ncbi:uncharacterized protein [Diadema antillarum]|uniref:uncharacterized protein n=1 Tax=Diadema antillarum TaxID=105358 RepID=UPI003A8C22BE